MWCGSVKCGASAAAILAVIIMAVALWLGGGGLSHSAGCSVWFAVIGRMGLVLDVSCVVCSAGVNFFAENAARVCVYCCFLFRGIIVTVAMHAVCMYVLACLVVLSTAVGLTVGGGGAGAFLLCSLATLSSTIGKMF